MMKVSFLSTVTAIVVLIHDVNALQFFGSWNAGSTKPAPLCDRVDLGTLSVSPMGFGTLNLPLDKETDDDSAGVLKTASECGINFVDTAEAVSSVLYTARHFYGNCMTFAHTIVGWHRS